VRGWAISVLQETGAIRECEEHGWMQDRADPHARERALDIARQEPRTAFLRKPHSRGSGTCWTRSGTLAPSARPAIDENRSRTFGGSDVTRFPDEFAGGNPQLTATRDHKWDALPRSALGCTSSALRLFRERSIMPAYFIVQNTIKDEAQYQKYVQAVVPFIASFGGKLAARRAKVEVLEGEHDQRPVVMFEFPDMEAIHAFWNSPDYVPIKKLREGIATMNI